ncbi:probable zinc transporter protein DDB_G0283629 isoform X2 [Halyomorpha halys]|uniref:probable zinc transporter protein DDB_G0283629 isoform X2 n=1 Tax=Halyomorpha halys TaxID=286706 RepID=UPI0034D35382
MLFFFYLISFLELTGAYVIPNYYPVYVGFNPLNQVLSQMHLANINNHNLHHNHHHNLHHNSHHNLQHNPHHNHHHTMQHMNHGNMFNQGLANNYYQIEKQEGGVTGSELDVHSGRIEGETSGDQHEHENEKHAEGEHHQTDSGELEKQNEAGKKKKKKKSKKGFHDVYKKKEKKSRKKFWNNYDRKGSYYRSKTKDGEHHEEMAGNDSDSDFNMMDLEKRIKDGDWDNGFVMSWKMKMAPNGTYVRYDQDFKEGYFDPSWSQDYIQ